MIGLLLLVALPLWRESAQGRFVLEPAERVVVRSKVPGVVTAVYAEEGMAVTAGMTLAELRNTPLESEYGRTETDYALASLHAASAAMRYDGLGTALQQQEALNLKTHNVGAQAAQLAVHSPITGVVLTPRTQDELGSYATEGTELIEIGDLRRMRARIYLPEHDLAKARVGAKARAQVDGSAKIWTTKVTDVARVSGEMHRSLVDLSDYKGLALPNVYFVDLYIPNSNDALRPGMTGTARIYGERRSVAWFAWREINQFLGRKFW